MARRPRTDIATIPISEVNAATSEGIEDEILSVDLGKIEALVCEDPRVESCTVNVVQPGQSVRLIHVLDSFRPVCSVEGSASGAFPGITSNPSSLDHFDAVELDNVLVTMVGHIPAVDSFLTQQEGILDLIGPGTELSPLGMKPHIVLDLVGAEGISSAETSNAFRLAAAKTSEHVASLALQSDQPKKPEVEVSPPAEGAARLVHICEVSAFGEMFDTLVAGKSVMGMMPLVISPGAMRTGAVVSADYHYAGQRNYTCFYQRNPVAEAVRDVGEGVQLAGTILLPVGGNDSQKSLGAAYAAHLASAMNADGAVITAVAGGNAHLDVMFAVRECESRGIRSVLSVVEMAGPDGNDPGMVDTVPEADLIVSTGNREALIDLPPIDNVIGGVALFGPEAESGGAPAAGQLRVPLRTVVGVNNEMGAWTIGGRLW